MKAKKRVPENSEQPKPLPAPSNKEREDELAPWQREIVLLAEARLILDGEQDVLAVMHQRAIGLCRVVEDMTLRAHENDVSLEALREVMRAAQESIQVARWIAAGKPLNPSWF